MKSNLQILLLIFIIHFSISADAFSQVPQGFNYQAIARDADGKEIASSTLQVMISVLSDTTGFKADGKGDYLWEEQHEVQTNILGLFSLVAGSPDAVKIQGSAASFKDIDWKQQTLFIGTKIYYQKEWKIMGSARLWTVPYSLVSSELAGPVKKLEVTGATTNLDEPLFEVKNKNGQTVFAVYSEGVRIYVDDGSAKGSKGGFAIGGFGTAKAGPQEYFVVSSDSIRAYIGTNPPKGSKGGFAIGGFTDAKAPGEEYLRVTRDSTRVYVNQDASKKSKGGFAIGGFDPAKGPVTKNFVNMTPNNYFIGHEAGKNINTGLYNNFIGYQAGYSNTDGGYNTFIGYQAGKDNLTGNSNVFVGYLSGEKNSSGTGNVFMGIYAGQDFQAGFNNTFIGSLAGQNFTNGSANIFIGRSAGTGYNFPTGTIGGTNNVLIGNYSAYYLTTGLNNVMLGNLSGFWNTSGYDNLFAGNQSGYANNSGYENVILGSYAGYSNNAGYQNVFIGIRAGYNNQAGKSNTFIGAGSGYSHSSGDGNVFIGSLAGGGLTAQSNRLYIDNSAVSKAEALIYGEFDNNLLTFNGNVGISRLSPATKLDIAGGNWNVAGLSEGDFRIGDSNYRLKIGVATAGGGAGDVRITAMGGTNRLILGGNGVDLLAITNASIYPWTDNSVPLGLPGNRFSVLYAANGTINTSDARMKENIRQINHGLESLLELEPVMFTWKGENSGKTHLGLLAQDVESVIPEVVDRGDDPSHTLGISYSELIPVMIRSIKQQQEQIESLKKENAELGAELRSIREFLQNILKDF